MAKMIPNCACATWARDGNDSRLFLSHHPKCSQHDAYGDVRELLVDLCAGIEQWACEEDGIYDDVYPAYYRAQKMLGNWDTVAKLDALDDEDHDEPETIDF